MQANVKYADHEGNAVRYTTFEAWWYVPEVPYVKWMPIDSAEITNHAKVLTEAQFNSQFPDLPALPTTAFQ